MREPIEVEPVQRPTIITIFAILTLVSCGLSIVGAIVSYDAFSVVSAMPSSLLPPWIKLIVPLVAAVKIVGAIFILQMRKIGVYLYVGAELFVVAALLSKLNTYLTFHNEMDELFYADVMFDAQTIFTVGVGVALVCSIVWSRAYWLNLKKMN